MLCVSLFSVFSSAAVDPKSVLPAEQAYQPQLFATEDGVTVQFNIADGYYLYQSKLTFNSDGPELSEPQFSPTQSKTDEFFGTQPVYFKLAQIIIPFKQAYPSQQPYHFVLEYQGCAEVGICYPPTRAAFDVKDVGLISPKQAGNVNVFTGQAMPSSQLATAQNTSSSSAWDLNHGSIWANLFTFFLAGIGLSLTACMYPLLPIVSSIIVGGKRNKASAFALSIVYVQGLALTYTVVGVLAGLTGALLTVWLQQAWVVLTAAALLVVLALAMFDVIQIQLPSRLQAYFQQQSSRLSGGKLASVFGMGMLSALIIGPCVAPPLAFALGYIAQSGNAWLGGMALYALALGTGLPLILVATFGAQVLPKAGVWMNAVKAVFGCLLLCAAVYLARPFLPFWLNIALYSLIWLALAIYILSMQFKFGRARWLMVVIGATLIASSGYFSGESIRGNSTVLHQVLSLQQPNQAHFGRQFTDVKALQDAMDTAFKADSNQVVYLDFYADWCVTCIQMQMNTFSDDKVKQAIDENRFFTIDVTANTPGHQALLKQYGLFGPPGIFKLSADGKTSEPLLGFVGADEFIEWSQQGIQ